MYRSFLIKYAEIGVKGKNRYLFEDRLCDQIRYALTRCEGTFEVTKSQEESMSMHFLHLTTRRQWNS